MGTLELLAAVPLLVTFVVAEQPKKVGRVLRPRLMNVCGGEAKDGE